MGPQDLHIIEEMHTVNPWGHSFILLPATVLQDETHCHERAVHT